MPKWHSIVHSWIFPKKVIPWVFWVIWQQDWAMIMAPAYPPLTHGNSTHPDWKHKTGEVDSTNLCAVKLQCTTLIQEWRPVVQQCSGCTAYFPWKPEFVGPLFAKMQINFLLSALTVPGNVANCRKLFMDIFGIHSVALRLGLTLLHKCSHHYAITKNVALPWSLPIF